MDIKMFYKERGQGFPLIMLHGNGEDHEYFEHQIEFFGNEYRVLAIDSRGHGKTPRGDGELSLKRFAEDLYEFMLEMKIEQAVLLGFSDGGNVALEFALLHSEMVKAMILNGANLFPSGMKKSVLEPIERAYYSAKNKALTDERYIEKAEILGLMVNEPNIAPQSLSELKIPTLVVVGSDDMIDEEHSKLIAKSIDGAVFEIIEGDHFVANKNYRAFNAVVDDFLKKII